MPLSRLLNVIYAFLTADADSDAIREFDERLERDPHRGPAPPKSRGTNALLALMGGSGQRVPGGG